MSARLFVSVQLKAGDDLVALTDRILAAAGVASDGSGVGFGMRDVDFTVPSLAVAHEVADRVGKAMLAEDRVAQWACYEECADDAHDWQEQPGEPPVDVCVHCGAVRE